MTSRKREGLVLVAVAALCMCVGAGAAYAAPERVLLIGDSMMRIPAHSIEQRLGRLGGIETESVTSLGSGLARLDVFDWMEKVDELVTAFGPEWTLVWFGTNDRQPMRTPDGIIQPRSQDAWSTEYARRVAHVMDKLTTSPEQRVIWLELPPMREGRLNDDIVLINELVAAEAARRAQVDFYPAAELFSRRPGAFSMHVAGPDGMPLRVREADGIHLNRAGADLLADRLLADVFQVTGSQGP